MYYEIVSVAKDGKEKTIKCLDGFFEAYFEALALRSVTACAIIAINRDDDPVFKLEFY